MTACRKRLVDAVVVYRYDRFARSLRQLVLALEEFRALGIDFISLHEGVDTSTPNGRLVFGIFASIAEFERELIRDRVRSGLAAARAKGKRIGRPRVPVDALRIGFLRHQGRSWAQIKADTGISKGTAQRAMAGLPKTPVATASPSADLPYPARADSHCPKPPGCGQLPFFSAGKPVSGEHEQSGSAKGHVMIRGNDRTSEPCA